MIHRGEQVGESDLGSPRDEQVPGLNSDGLSGSLLIQLRWDVT